MAALSIGVATMSSLASFKLEIPRSKGNVDARLNESGSTRSKQVTHDVANWLRMNARRAHEWIGMFQEAWLDFNCELVLYSLIVQHFVTNKELYRYNRNTKLYHVTMETAIVGMACK